MVPEKEVREEFSKIFEEVGRSLDITEAQYNTVVDRYTAVGNYLSESGTELAPFKPEILPQGSFMLGTMIKPVHEDDELDIDLVCKLEGKQQNWTQYDVKRAIGNRLASSPIYGKLLDEEGRRCWTLQYSEKARFHLDILPAIVGNNYKVLLEKALTPGELRQIADLVVSITDKETDNYRTETKAELWLRSNPFGYAKWFEDRANLEFNKSLDLRESVRPVPAYQKNKLPLVRIVQVLKRHRDILFEGDADKPISIAITTLAACAYSKEIDLMEGLLNVVNRMSSFIKDREDLASGKSIKWISNPINISENFADKWVDSPNKQRNFYIWLRRVKEDIENISYQRSDKIFENMEKPFGKSLITESFNRYGETKRLLRESGNLHMAPKTGIIGSVGYKVKNHNFFGNGK